MAITVTTSSLPRNISIDMTSLRYHLIELFNREVCRPTVPNADDILNRLSMNPYPDSRNMISDMINAIIYRFITSK